MTMKHDLIRNRFGYFSAGPYWLVFQMSVSSFQLWPTCRQRTTYFPSTCITCFCAFGSWFVLLEVESAWSSALDWRSVPYLA